MPKIKDLNQYLTATTGLDAQQREEWRKCIRQLMDRAKGITDPIEQRAAKQEALKVFDSFSYWKERYAGKEC